MRPACMQVHEIVRLAAPHVPQSHAMPQRYRPGAGPALLPSDPATWPPMAGQEPQVAAPAQAQVQVVVVPMEH